MSDQPPDADKPVEDANTEPQTYVTVIVNPVLAAWGKFGGRIEVAPLAAHALFFELSSLSFDVPEVDRHLSGMEYDFGYHFFPLGHGVDGFYIGPRLIYAHGESDEVVGSLWGFGADLGYQLVIIRYIALNAGIGAAHVSATVEPQPGYVDQAQALGFDGSLSQSVSFWVPLATLGAGMAF